MKILTLVFKNTPKWIKWIIGSVILAQVTVHFVILYLTGQKIILSMNALIQILVGALILLIIGLFTGYHKTVKILLISDEKIKNTIGLEKQKVLKKLPDNIEIDTIVKDKLKWDISFRRCFLPNDNPGRGKFIKKLEFSDVRCSDCNSIMKEDTSHVVGRKGIKYIYCPNESCSNQNFKLDKFSYNRNLEQLIIQIENDIYSNYSKYWNLYCKKYDELTLKKYDEFQPPLQ